MANPGSFIPFYLDYKLLSFSQQATAILEKADNLITDGAPGVAITYSANWGQTVEINKVYDEGGWNTGTSGSNQAEVMMEMESLEGTTYAYLQGKVRIAPITTMTYSGGYQETDPTNPGKTLTYTHQQVIESDLDNIETLLDEGWMVLGWQNNSSLPNYAVGGGVSQSPGPGGVVQFPQALSDMVQATLKQFAADYPYPPAM